MQNPFQHINDVLNFSGKEASRMLRSQVNTEHLMLGILHANNKQVNDIFDHFGINADVLRSTLYDSQEKVMEEVSVKGDEPEADKRKQGKGLTYNFCRDQRFAHRGTSLLRTLGHGGTYPPAARHPEERSERPSQAAHYTRTYLQQTL